MSGPLGYGRYGDSPYDIGCPRARTDMTPCVARDGANAVDDDGTCVGCGAQPIELLTRLVREVTKPPENAEAYSLTEAQPNPLERVNRMHDAVVKLAQARDYSKYNQNLWAVMQPLTTALFEIAKLMLDDMAPPGYFDEAQS